MSPGVELPEDLVREAKREQVLPSEQARQTLLLASGLRKEHPEGAFVRAVRAYFEARSLDYDRVSSAFDDFVLLLTRSRCDPASIDAQFGSGDAKFPPIEILVGRPGGVRPSALGKYAHLGVSTEDLMAEKCLDMEREERKSR